MRKTEVKHVQFTKHVNGASVTVYAFIREVFGSISAETPTALKFCLVLLGRCRQILAQYPDLSQSMDPQSN
jgi:hypothetical protein